MELTVHDSSNENTSSLGVRAVIISNCSGLPLVSLKIDPTLDENTMIPFITAIQSYCTNLIAKTHELYFQTEQLDLYVFIKNFENFELMIYALIERGHPKTSLREEAEFALDAFVKFYSLEIIRNWDGNTDTFRPFERKLQEQVDNYLQHFQSGQITEKRGFIRQLWKKIFNLH